MAMGYLSPESCAIIVGTLDFTDGFFGISLYLFHLLEFPDFAKRNAPRSLRVKTEIYLPYVVCLILQMLGGVTIIYGILKESKLAMKIWVVRKAVVTVVLILIMFSSPFQEEQQGQGVTGYCLMMIGINGIFMQVIVPIYNQAVLKPDTTKITKYCAAGMKCLD